MSDNMDEPYTEEEIAGFKQMKPGPIIAMPEPRISKRFLTALGFLSYYENSDLSLHRAAEILSELIKDDY
jgi:hypothetical protein